MLFACCLLMGVLLVELWFLLICGSGLFCLWFGMLTPCYCLVILGCVRLTILVLLMFLVVACYFGVVA